MALPNRAARAVARQTGFVRLVGRIRGLLLSRHGSFLPLSLPFRLNWRGTEEGEGGIHVGRPVS